MDFSNKKRTAKYDRVMSRLFNRSRTNMNSKSYVTRHETPSTVSIGAKPSSSNVNFSVISELPVFLNDYSPEVPVKRTFVVKPRRTVKSLDPSSSPHRATSKSEVKVSKRNPEPKVCNIRAGGSAPVVSSRAKDRWSDTHVRQCFSSRSHTRLKELKDEIQQFRECDKQMKLRSRLYQSCGVILDDVGQVAADKAIQVAESDYEEIRLIKWLRLMCREDLKGKTSFSGYRVCEIHFSTQDTLPTTSRTILKKNALPSLYLPDLPETNNASSDFDQQEDKETQTEDISVLPSSSSSNNNSRKRKLKNEISDTGKQTINKDGALPKLSDKYLTKELILLLKAQILSKLPKNENRYDKEYVSFCSKLYSVSAKAYEFLQDALCLPCPTVLFSKYPSATDKNDEDEKNNDVIKDDQDQEDCT